MQHALALSSVLTFLLEHHAEAIDYVHVITAHGSRQTVIFLSAPPRGATMLGWTWEPSSLRGKVTHVTPSGIVIHAPESA